MRTASSKSSISKSSINERSGFESSENTSSEKRLSGQPSGDLSNSSSARLLRRLSPLDYREAKAAQLAAPLPNNDRSGRVTVLIFRLCREWFALPAQLCRQVLAPMAAHTLPHRSNSTLIGIVNVSGQMLLKVSLLDLLGGISGDSGINGAINDVAPAGHYRKIYPRMVVVERARAGETSEGNVDVWGFDVDELEGICALDIGQFESPATGIQASGSYTRQVFRWQETSVNLLDDERLFDALRQRAL